MSDAIACDLGRRAEPFLLTKTSVGSVSEYIKPYLLKLVPVKSSRGRVSRVFIDWYSLFHEYRNHFIDFRSVEINGGLDVHTLRKLVHSGRVN